MLSNVIFEYIRCTIMELNEYGIFEYSKNGHSLGALPTTTSPFSFLLFCLYVCCSFRKLNLKKETRREVLFSQKDPLSAPHFSSLMFCPPVFLHSNPPRRCCFGREMPAPILAPLRLFIGRKRRSVTVIMPQCPQQDWNAA